MLIMLELTTSQRYPLADLYEDGNPCVSGFNNVDKGFCLAAVSVVESGILSYVAAVLTTLSLLAV